MKHENFVTLSVYVKDITCLVYDEKTDEVTTKTYEFFNEKVPSDTILKKELEEEYGDTIIKVKSITQSDKTKLVKMTHRKFYELGEIVGEVREKKVKE